MNKEYLQYLKSTTWGKQKNKTLYWHKKRCGICGKKKRALDIHHKTYKRIFQEDVKSDLIPLCRPCHESIHKDAKAGLGDVYHLTEQRLKTMPKTWKEMSPLQREKFLGPAL